MLYYIVEFILHSLMASGSSRSLPPMFHGMERENTEADLQVICISVVAKAVYKVNNIKMWRYDNMDIENCNGLVDELKKHMDDWRDFAICEKCGVAIIIGPQGDLRNYLYPQPYFPIVPETMEILCHDCYRYAEDTDQMNR